MTGDAQSIILSEITRTTLTSSIDAAGDVVLTASVSTDSGGGVPGGTIRFVDETTLTVLGWAGVATPSIVIHRLSEGAHRFRAIYGGSTDFLPVVVQASQSDLVIRTIRTVPAVSVSSSDNPSEPGAVITLTAAIQAHGVVPTGIITFRDGDRVLAAHVVLDRAGTASFTTSALSEGPRAITAEYGGDATHAPAESPRLVQDVGTVRFSSSQLARDGR